MSLAFDVLTTVALLAATLILPGVAWAPLLHPEDPEGLIDRALLTMGVSIVIVPLTVFWLGLLFGIPVTRLSIGVIAAALVATPIAFRYARSRYSHGMS